MSVDYEVEYNNRARVPEHPEIFARWQREAAAYRELRRTTPSSASPTARRRARPSTCSRPRRRRRRRSRCSSMAAGGARWSRRCFSHGGRARMRAASRSRSPATISARSVTIADIIEQMRAACLLLWRKRGKRMMVYGHSAGGHLAACMVATDWKAFASEAPADLVPAAMRSPACSISRRWSTCRRTRTCGSTKPRARRVSPLYWRVPAGRSARRRGGRAGIERIPAPEPHHRRSLAAGVASRRATRKSPAPTISPCVDPLDRSGQRDDGARGCAGAERQRVCRLSR